MIRAGELGDTEAIELIMNRLPAKGQAAGCVGWVRPPHAAEALRRLTAHDAGDMAEGWHAWWRVHQGKSQATLIRESFRPLGIDPQKPPTKEQTLSLLRLIGLPFLLEGQTRDLVGAPTPGMARTFNAMRILRDHDVKPEIVTRQELLRADGESILKGVVMYADFRARNPLSNEAGVVFGNHSGYSYEEYMQEQRWTLRSPWAPWAWFGGGGALVVGSVVGGRALWRSRRKDNNFCKSDAHS
jgi:hypothetical protein